MRVAAALTLGLIAGIYPLPAGGGECPATDVPGPSARVWCPPIDRAGPPARAALRVFLDRRTGRLRAPTPEEARALVETGGAGPEYLEPLEVVVHPNGMRSVDLKGAFSFNVVTRKNPNGSVSTRCVPAGLEKR
jgi:hypothetical protein